MRVTVGNNNWAWEDETVYAVFHWERASERVSWTEYMHELFECDLLMAIRWAEDHAEGRPWALAVLINDKTESPGNERGLVWLLGHDLNAGIDPSEERRMHERVGRRLLADTAR